MRTERRSGVRVLAASIATVVGLGLPTASIETGSGVAMAANTSSTSECVPQFPFYSLQKPLLIFQAPPTEIANPNQVAKFGEVREVVTNLSDQVLHEVFNRRIGPKGNGAIKNIPGIGKKWNPKKPKFYNIDLAAHFRSAPLFPTQNGGQTVCEQPTVGEVSLKIPKNLDRAYLQLVNSRHKTKEKILALARKIHGLYLSYFDKMNFQHTENIYRDKHGWDLVINGNLSAATDVRDYGLGTVPFTRQRLSNANGIGEMLTENFKSKHQASVWSSAS